MSSTSDEQILPFCSICGFCKSEVSKSSSAQDKCKFEVWAFFFFFILKWTWNTYRGPYLTLRKVLFDYTLCIFDFEFACLWVGLRTFCFAFYFVLKLPICSVLGSFVTLKAFTFITLDLWEYTVCTLCF